MIAFIADLLEKKYMLDEENVEFVIPFEQPELLDVQSKFEILIYKYKERFGSSGLSAMIDRYGLAEEKRL